MSFNPLRQSLLKVLLFALSFQWVIWGSSLMVWGDDVGEFMDAPPQLRASFPHHVSIQLNESLFKSKKFKEYQDQLKYLSRVKLVFEGKMLPDRHGKPHVSLYRVVEAVGQDGKKYPPEYFSFFPLFTTQDISHTIRDTLDTCKELDLNAISLIRSRAMKDWFDPDYHWVYDKHGNRFRDMSLYFDEAPVLKVKLSLPGQDQRWISYYVRNLSLIKEIRLSD